MAWFSPNPLLLPEIITLNASFLRGKPAVIIDDCEVSWEQFGSGTAKFANALSALGLAQGDRVVVLMTNSFEMAEAMFGLIRAGFVAVPLNVSITDDAVAGMIDNCNAKAVVASGEHVQRIENMREKLAEDLVDRLISPDPAFSGWIRYQEIRDAASSDVPDVVIRPEDECNLIYSSGTTGLPKGIVHDHACREAWGSDMAVALRYHSGARTLCNLGLFSNITWVCMLATFFAGGTLIISRRFTPQDCLETIQKHRVTHTGMVPLQYQKLYEYPDFKDFDLSSLNSSMCCGSPLPPPLKRELAEHWEGEFIELYGLTEGLVTILSPEDLMRKPDSVGQPSPGQRLAIIDDEGSVLPAGQAGEIVGASRFMMAGYHQNDAANEEATWLHSSGERWLRTGDVGFLDEDGFLHLVDRKKDMILSGGQNIYPADIEAVMSEHDAISEIAVIAAESVRWGETPLAVVVLRNPIAGDELTAWANSRLGKQQRIAATVFVDELPRNPNGKVLKRELRQQFSDMKF